MIRCNVIVQVVLYVYNVVCTHTYIHMFTVCALCQYGARVPRLAHSNQLGFLHLGSGDIHLYPVPVKTQGGEKIELQVCYITFTLMNYYSVKLGDMCFHLPFSFCAINTCTRSDNWINILMHSFLKSNLYFLKYFEGLVYWHLTWFLRAVNLFCNVTAKPWRFCDGCATVSS